MTEMIWCGNRKVSQKGLTLQMGAALIFKIKKL
jgi:hypothetical protein